MKAGLLSVQRLKDGVPSTHPLRDIPERRDRLHQSSIR
jgi:hypothetical protein